MKDKKLMAAFSVEDLEARTESVAVIPTGDGGGENPVPTPRGCYWGPPDCYFCYESAINCPGTRSARFATR